MGYMQTAVQSHSVNNSLSCL